MNKKLSFLTGLLYLGLAVPLILTTGAPAMAQAVVASVNDDPVTNIDIDQHTRILRVLRRNATREAALESIYETRLKLIELSKYKLTPSDQDIGFALSATANGLKLQPQQLLVALQRAGVTDDQWKQKWKADAGWAQFIRALNRTLEVSENEVRGELARQGKSKSTEYTLRQVILVVPNGAGGGVLQGRLQEAQQLRAKFADCNTGVEAARATRDTVVNAPLRRSASALTPQLIKMLDQTAVGKLTQPTRGAQGVEMLAVCDKASREDTAAADSVRNEILTKRLEGESNRRYQDVRAKAVIVRK